MWLDGFTAPSSDPRAARSDALLGAGLLVGWTGLVVLALRWDYWWPQTIEGYLWTGVGFAVPVALRRLAPRTGYWVTVIGYPLGYTAVTGGGGLGSDLHALPLVAAAFLATAAGLTAWVVGPCTSVTVVVLQVGATGIGSTLRGSPVPPFLSRTALLVLLVAAAAALGALVRRLNGTLRVLADRNAELRALQEERTRAAVHEERTRIARELHDVVAHHVTAIVVRAQAADRVGDREPEASRDAVRWIAPTGREALSAMRSAVRALRGAGEDGVAPLAPAPGLADLPAVLARMRGAGLAVSADLPEPLPPCPPAVALAVVRTTQEALTNVLAHSTATRARLRLERGGARWTLEIDDPGPARATPTATGGGHGVGHMRERAAACGGMLTAGPRGDGGWVVRMDLPA
ncbi:sensor histidine kinase [Cellulosimicrobium cellulans]|uniref:sensor histidine kinase n=1 Tax=Cellulosimicrobium cellulans TaxID=1710 RepID=UPI0016526C09|nr:histidine kinase [Cellulosimicrobium cellulans]